MNLQLAMQFGAAQISIIVDIFTINMSYLVNLEIIVIKKNHIEIVVLQYNR